MRPGRAAAIALEQWLQRQLRTSPSNLQQQGTGSRHQVQQEWPSQRLERWVQWRIASGKQILEVEKAARADPNQPAGFNHVDRGESKLLDPSSGSEAEAKPAGGPTGRHLLIDPLQHGNSLSKEENALRYVLPLELERYAQIHVAAVELDGSLDDVLAEQDLDRGVWTDHLRRQREALQKEAERGQTNLAEAIEKALEQARSQQAPRSNDGEPSLCSLETYAAVRVQLERGVPLLQALITVEADRQQWQYWSKSWLKQTRKNRKAGQELQRALAKARRTKQN